MALDVECVLECGMDEEAAEMKALIERHSSPLQ
jgi:hypothetical protein